MNVKYFSNITSYITSQKSDQFLTITFRNEANNKNTFVLCFLFRNPLRYLKRLSTQISIRLSVIAAWVMLTGESHGPC